MPDGEQMNLVLLQIESVNDSILADTGTKAIRSFQSVVRIRYQAQSDFIDLRLYPSAKGRWQLQEDGVEARVINLRRRAHEPSGSRTRTLFPLAMSRSDCRMELSNSGVNCSSSSITSSNHSRICLSSPCESLRSSSSTCSTLVTNKSFNRYFESASLAGSHHLRRISEKRCC